MDAVVISIPQMDTISVAFMERTFYKKKIESNKYRFDLLILDIEKMEETIRYKDEVIEAKDLIIEQKDFEIGILNKQRELDKLSKPTFLQKAGTYSLFTLFGLILGVLINL